MKYSEEEIECYTNILKNLNDGLDIYTPIRKTIPLKKPKRISCKNCGNNKHFFKERGLRYWNKCFCYWPTFIKDYTVVTFSIKVFTIDHIIYRIDWKRL